MTLTTLVYQCSDGRIVVQDNNFTATFLTDGLWHKGFLVTGSDLQANFTQVTNQTQIASIAQSARTGLDEQLIYSFSAGIPPVPTDISDITTQAWANSSQSEILLVDNTFVGSFSNGNWYRGNALDGSQIGVSLLSVTDKTQINTWVTQFREAVGSNIDAPPGSIVE